MEAINQFQQIDPLYIQLFFIGLSALVILLEIPLAMNRIRPNTLYGFRVHKTLSNERVWYLVNSYAAKRAIVAGVIAIVMAVALRIASVSPVIYVLICSLVFTVGFLIAIIDTVIYMNRIS